jgi:hypothetical protein
MILSFQKLQTQMKFSLPPPNEARLMKPQRIKVVNISRNPANLNYIYYSLRRPEMFWPK